MNTKPLLKANAAALAMGLLLTSCTNEGARSTIVEPLPATQASGPSPVQSATYSGVISSDAGFNTEIGITRSEQHEIQWGVSQ